MLTDADRAELARKYPNRDTPRISSTEGFDFIVLSLGDSADPNMVFTKDHSCYLSPTGFKAGVCPDYRTEDKAQDAADRCNRVDPDGNYVVRRVV